MTGRTAQNKNSGFTLVELIVCIVIFAIILAAVFGFMLSSANSYSRVNTRINIELQGQVAASQICEYLTDCSYGVCAETDEDGVTLYIADRYLYKDGDNITTEDSGRCKIHAYQYLISTGVIKYGSATGTVNPETGAVSVSGLQIDAPLTKYTEGFSVEFSDDGTADPRVRLAEVEVYVKVHADTGVEAKSVALRNRPFLMTASASGGSVILTPVSIKIEPES